MKLDRKSTEAVYLLEVEKYRNTSPVLVGTTAPQEDDQRLGERIVRNDFLLSKPY